MANKVIIDEDMCKGCSMCIAACPKEVLELNQSKLNARGYNPSTIARIEDCIACGMCATMCPDSVISVYKEEKE